MPEYVGEFEVAMEYLVLEEVMKAIDDFAEYLDGLLLSEVLALLDVAVEIAVVAVLQHQVVVVGCLLHVVELDDVVALAALQHLDLALQQLLELACVHPRVPFTFSRRMDFTAMSLLVARS